MLSVTQERAKSSIEQKIAAGIYRYETPACLCGAMRFIPLAERDRFGLSHHVVRCENCGLVQANPRLNADSYRQFYEQDYRRLYSTSVNIPLQFKNMSERGEKVYRFIDKHCQIPQHSRVLEIGCSSGGILVPFEKRGHRVQGFDYDREFVKYGNSQGLALFIGDLFDVSGMFDLAIYNHVLEHILTPDKELAQAHSLLVERGLLYIEVPDIESHTRLGILESVTWQIAHTYYYSINTLEKLVEDAGFKIIYLVQVGRSIRSLWRK